MKKTIEERRLDFLNDTIQYYSEDTSRRATTSVVSISGSCRYRTSDGRKCAIGRHIPDDKYDESIENVSCGHRSVMKLLPIEIQELGRIFLINVQALHDPNHNWNLETGKGLSKIGKKNVENIINKYCI